MTARQIRQAAVLAACLALLTSCVAGCQVRPLPRRHGRPVPEAAQAPALLMLILGAASAQARADLNVTVTDTARTGEHLVVLSRSGRTLGFFSAPSPPDMTGPAFPSPLRGDATSFQKAAYQRSLTQANAVLRQDRRSLALRLRSSLRAWATNAARTAWAAMRRHSVGQPSLARAIVAAAAAESSLRQAGLSFGSRQVLGIIDISGAVGPVALPASLTGMTVALTGVPDGSADAAWQADLLQAGATRAYVLPAQVSELLPGLIAGGLAGRDAVPFSVAGFTYAPAQYALPRAATRSLDRLLRLLMVTYPTATATINGYTDDVPVPGGNVNLSWKRAKAVFIWLVAHHVSAARLQVFGQGTADPVVPTSAAAQPLDRRVVVIVSPAG